MRLIDADKLIKEFLNVCRTEFEVKNKCMTDENVLHLIYDAPTIKPTITCKECDGYEAGYSAGRHDARPKGEWIEIPVERDLLYNTGIKYTCSICGRGNCYGKPPFCMYCGADMRVKDELNNELNELGGRE